jgi:hypothetical protein
VLVLVVQSEWVVCPRPALPPPPSHVHTPCSACAPLPPGTTRSAVALGVSTPLPIAHKDALIAEMTTLNSRISRILAHSRGLSPAGPASPASPASPPITGRGGGNTAAARRRSSFSQWIAALPAVDVSLVAQRLSTVHSSPSPSVSASPLSPSRPGPGALFAHPEVPGSVSSAGDDAGDYGNDEALAADDELLLLGSDDGLGAEHDDGCGSGGEERGDDDDDDGVDKEELRHKMAVMYGSLGPDGSMELPADMPILARKQSAKKVKAGEESVVLRCTPLWQ